MAGRYYSPLDYTGAMATANAAIPNPMEIIDQARLRNVQEGELRRKNAEYEAKTKALGDYQADLAWLNANYSPENLALFMRKWPEHAEEAKKAHDLVTEAGTKRALHQGGELIYALDHDLPTAQGIVDDMITAATAAGGKPDTILTGLRDAIHSGDANRIGEAKAAANSILFRALGDAEYVKRMVPEPDALEKQWQFMQSKGYGTPFLETKAYGPVEPIFQGEKLVGGARYATLPRIDISGGGAQPPAPDQPTTIKALMADMKPTVDQRRGLTMATHPRFPHPIPVVFSAEDLAKVESGETYFSTKDDQPHTKP